MNIGSSMQPQGIMQANPPYIMFEKRAVERRKTDAEGAGVYYVDVDFALVTSHGSKDTVEKEALVWFDFLKEQVRQGRFPQQWLDAFKASYNAWKSDQEPPVVGTSIRNWPAASPAEIKLLTGFGIRAVEDLAGANEELINRLGMGGRSLCARAKDWVLSKDNTAPLVAQMDSLRQVNIGLQSQIDSLTQSNCILQQQLSQRETNRIADPMPVLPALEDRLADARARADGGMSDDEAITEALQE